MEGLLVILVILVIIVLCRQGRGAATPPLAPQVPRRGLFPGWRGGLVAIVIIAGLFAGLAWYQQHGPAPAAPLATPAATQGAVPAVIQAVPDEVAACQTRPWEVREPHRRMECFARFNQQAAAVAVEDQDDAKVAAERAHQRELKKARAELADLKAKAAADVKAARQQGKAEMLAAVPGVSRLR